MELQIEMRREKPNRSVRIAHQFFITHDDGVGLELTNRLRDEARGFEQVGLIRMKRWPMLFYPRLEDGGQDRQRIPQQKNKFRLRKNLA